MRWPTVLTEAETLERVVAGASIARFGDGELNIADGGETLTHAANERLMAEIRRILVDPAPGLLPAIPTMRPDVVRASGWVRSRERWLRFLDLDRVYGSAFVGRAKCAPWIATDAYRRRFHDVWRGRPAVAVCPPTHPLPRLLREGGADVVGVVECPLTEAYSRVDELEEAAADHVPLRSDALVVICAGPAAKCLANRFTLRGVQSIDLGRGAGFILKNRRARA